MVRASDESRGSAEAFRLHFLVGAPKNPALQEAFEKATRILAKSAARPEFVLESDADALAAELEREMRAHGVDERPLF